MVLSFLSPVNDILARCFRRESREYRESGLANTSSSSELFGSPGTADLRSGDCCFVGEAGPAQLCRPVSGEVCPPILLLLSSLVMLAGIEVEEAERGVFSELQNPSCPWTGVRHGEDCPFTGDGEFSMVR